MYIYSRNPGPIRPDAVTKSGNLSQTEPVQPTAPGSSSSGVSADKVEISDAGRALAARNAASGSVPVDAERASEIRERILSGAYNTLDVVDSVARRLLDSGDL